jgi:hypothetical protein
MTVSFHVTLKTTAPVGEYQGVESYVADYTATLWARPDGVGEATVAGRIRACHAMLGLALNHKESFWDVCDAHSGDLLAAALALFDPETADFHEDVTEEFDCASSDLLFFQSLRLAPRWRGLRLGLLAVRAVADRLESGCGLIVCDPLDLRDADEAGKATAGQRRRYWRRLGFRPLRRDRRLYALSPSQLAPTVDDLLRAGKEPPVA